MKHWSAALLAINPMTCKVQVKILDRNKTDQRSKMMSKDMGSGPTVLADTHSGQLGAMFPSQGGSPGRHKELQQQKVKTASSRLDWVEKKPTRAVNETSAK